MGSAATSVPIQTTYLTDCNGSPDTLVLKIEEISDNEIDSTLFILYDHKVSHYIVYGKRSNVFAKLEFVPYSFRCKSVFDLADFISFVKCKQNKWNYTLYNYDNLPCNSDDISYDFLKSLDGDRSYEIAGYDNKVFNDRYLVKTLKMLKGVFNIY
jgi:hypothetical protein